MTAIDLVILHTGVAAAIDGQFSQERLRTTRGAFFARRVVAGNGLRCRPVAQRGHGAMSDLGPLCAQQQTFVSQPLRLAGNSSTAVSRPGAAIAYFSVSFLRDGPTGLHRPETTG
jgi:hypothetical protein